MNIIDFLVKNAKVNSTKTAIIDTHRSITFEELYKEVKIFSNSDLFLDEQNVISLVSENSISFIIAYLGIINSGKIVHLVPPEITENNLSNQINVSNSKAIICNSTLKKNFLKLESINIPIFEFEEISSKNKNQKNISKINEFAYLIYTSGTTSEPKGVSISHSMIEFTTKNIIKVLGYSNRDIDLLPLPLHHSFGLGCFHTSLFVGSTLVLLKNASDLEMILESIKKFKITTLAAIPATLTKLLKLDKNLLIDSFLNLRLIITNSTSIPKNTVQNFNQLLKNGYLSTYYGLTEASRSTFMIFEKNKGREGSVGKMAPGVTIKIENEESTNQKIGEIWIKGNNVIKKYWNNNEADKKLTNGWLQTGDMGYFDEYGYLFLKGRKDEAINIGGEKVIPIEIEQVVKELSGIEDVVAFGIHHEIFGQVIKLNVIKTKNSDLDKAQILSHCIKNLEKFKIPSKIDFVEKIPKTDYGKVKRFMLK